MYVPGFALLNLCFWYVTSIDFHLPPIKTNMDSLLVTQLVPDPPTGASATKS